MSWLSILSLDDQVQAFFPCFSETRHKVDALFYVLLGTERSIFDIAGLVVFQGSLGQSKPRKCIGTVYDQESRADKGRVDNPHVCGLCSGRNGRAQRDAGLEKNDQCGKDEMRDDL